MDENKIFEGAIFLKSELDRCEANIYGTAIAIAGMTIKLFESMLERTTFKKSDIETMLKIASKEIDKNSKEYEEHQDRVIKMTLKKI